MVTRFSRIGRGEQGGGPSAIALLDQLRAIRTARLARQAEEEIAQQQTEIGRRRQVALPSPDRQPPPDPTSLLQNLRQAARLPELIQNPVSFFAQPKEALEVGKATLAAREQITQPVAAAFMAGPQLPESVRPVHRFLFGDLAPDDAEFERRDRSNRLLRDFAGGRIGLEETRASLQGIQQERPLALQIASETFNPLGAVETLVPVGRASGVATKVAKPAAKVAQPRVFQVGARTFAAGPDGAVAETFGVAEEITHRQVVQLPGFYEILRMTSTKLLREDLRKIPGVGKFVDAVPEAASSNTEDIIPQFLKVHGIYAEQGAQAADALTARILARGDPKILFQLDNEFRSTLSGPMRGKFLNEIAQHPGQFNLTATQRGWLDNFRNVTDDVLRYMQAEGVIPDAPLFAGSVKGRYFPNFWKQNRFLDDVAFTGARGRRARAAARAEPPFTKSRFYEDASEAIKAGHRPGDPMQTINLLYKSMYNQVIDKRLNDVLRPHFGDITKRLDGDVLREIRGASEQQLIRDFNAIPPAQIKALVKALQPQTKNWLSNMASASAAVRTMRAGLDLRVGFIHGLPVLLTNPAV